MKGKAHGMFIEATECHTDLNVFAAVQKILEGGCIYTSSGDATAGKIIKLCLAEQQRQIRRYDRIMETLAKEPANGQ